MQAEEGTSRAAARRAARCGETISNCLNRNPPGTADPTKWSDRRTK